MQKVKRILFLFYNFFLSKELMKLGTSFDDVDFFTQVSNIDRNKLYRIDNLQFFPLSLLLNFK
jgi:hypothetical protein